MKKIRAYVDYEDRTKTHYYINFEVIDKLPKINDDNNLIEIKNVELDCEQGNDKVYNYNYYELIYKYDNEEQEEQNILDTYSEYVCIEKEDE